MVAYFEDLNTGFLGIQNLNVGGVTRQMRQAAKRRARASVIVESARENLSVS